MPASFCTLSQKGELSPRILKGWQGLRLLWRFQNDRIGTLLDLAREGRDVIVVTPVGRYVFLMRLTSLQQVIRRDFGSFGRGLGLRTLGYALGEGMLTSDGAKWQHARRAHSRNMRQIPEDLARDAVADIAQQFDVASEIVCETLGKQFAAIILQKALNQPSTRQMMHCVSRAERVSGLASRVMTLPSDRLHRAIMYLLSGPLGLWGLRRWAGTNLNGLDLPPQERLGLLFAGGETLSASLAWSLLRLAHCPDWQTRLRCKQERADVLAFLAEVLRLHPPVWMISRRALRETRLEGLQLRQGDEILIPLWALHRDHAAFDDADDFRPSRHLSASQPCAQMPFGGGPHMCPGRAPALALLSVALTELIRRFHFEPLLPADTGAWIGSAGLALSPGGMARVMVRPIAKRTLQDGD